MSRTDRIADAGDADEVLYLGLLKYKGACGKPYIFLVEGGDDVTFVDACLGRVNPNARQRVASYNCGGKGNVLKLHDLIRESREVGWNDFWCFIDRDFDEMRGHEASARIWMTPTYSFENLLVSENVLEGLLTGEFRCNDADGAQDLIAVKHYFQEFLESYKAVLYFANLCAFHTCKNRIKTHSHDDTITPTISVNFPKVEISLSKTQILKKMSRDGSLVEGDVLLSEPTFGKLEPLTEWRGKFLFAAFIAFLGTLKSDRGSKRPTLFSKKAKMKFDPRTDPIRTLSSLADIPQCLAAYLKTVPT